VRRAVLSLAIATLLPVAALEGQAPEAPARRPSTEGMAHLADPSVASAISAPVVTAILEGTTTSKTATARIGLQAADFLLDATLSGPLNSDTREARPATLNGLSGSATLSVGLGWIDWHPVTDPGRMQAVCDRYFRATGHAVDPCAASNLPEGPWRRRLNAAVDYGTPVILSLRGTIGRRSFSFIDTTSLARSTAQRTVGSIAASAGVYGDAMGFFVLSWAYEVSYSAGDAVQVCQPLGTSGATRCEDQRLHGPVRDRTSLVQLEYRRLFGEAFGLRPAISYRAASGTWGYQLPLYFLRDQRGLTGGVSLGWRSDTRETTVRVFVGEVLGLVAGPD
jgi:hypothetical protein